MTLFADGDEVGEYETTSRAVVEVPGEPVVTCCEGLSCTLR